MPHGEYANCSKCGKVAHGHDENEVLFGYRYFGTKPQSWCRECRSNGKNNYNDDDYDGDESEELSVGEAAQIWSSNGKDEDYMFEYTRYTSYTTGIEDMMLEMGIRYEFSANKNAKNENAEKLHKHVVQSGGIWYPNCKGI